MTDIEIAQAHEMKPITEIAAAAGIDEQHLELYGKYKAKLDLTEIRKLPRKAKLILVTAISPTPAGECNFHHQTILRNQLLDDIYPE